MSVINAGTPPRPNVLSSYNALASNEITPDPSKVHVIPSTSQVRWYVLLTSPVLVSFSYQSSSLVSFTYQFSFSYQSSSLVSFTYQSSSSKF